MSPAPSIFVGLAPYLGVTPSCFRSLLAFHVEAKARDLRHTFRFNPGSSLWHASRDWLANTFLESDRSHLLLVSDKIEVSPKTIFAMIEKHAPMVGIEDGRHQGLILIRRDAFERMAKHAEPYDTPHGEWRSYFGPALGSVYDEDGGADFGYRGFQEFFRRWTRVGGQTVYANAKHNEPWSARAMFEPKSDVPRSPETMFIGVPVFQRLGVDWVTSTIGLHNHLLASGIAHQFSFATGDEDVHAARDSLAGKFMESSLSAMLMIDADIGYPADLPTRMLGVRENFVGAVAPMRGIRPEYVDAAAKAGHAHPSRNLLQYAYQSLPADIERGTLAVDPRGIAEVALVGTAFVLLRRRVFEAIAATGKVRSLVAYGKQSYFLPMVQDRRSYGEDGAFSLRWRQAGGKVFMMVDAQLRHTGDVTLDGNVSHVLG